MGSNAACTTIMITKRAYAALGGGPARHIRRSTLYPARLFNRDLERLTANRGPTESYSDVIMRLAKLEKKNLLGT